MSKKKVHPFYKSREWKLKRQEILRRDNFECQLCKARGLANKGVLVHHIKPLKSKPHLAFDNDNLITLCTACHEKEHRRLDGYRVKKKEKKQELLPPERWE